MNNSERSERDKHKHMHIHATSTHSTDRNEKQQQDSLSLSDNLVFIGFHKFHNLFISFYFHLLRLNTAESETTIERRKRERICWEALSRFVLHAELIRKSLFYSTVRFFYVNSAYLFICLNLVVYYCVCVALVSVWPVLNDIDFVVDQKNFGGFTCGFAVFLSLSRPFSLRLSFFHWSVAWVSLSCGTWFDCVFLRALSFIILSERKKTTGKSLISSSSRRRSVYLR